MGNVVTDILDSLADLLGSLLGESPKPPPAPLRPSPDAPVAPDEIPKGMASVRPGTKYAGASVRPGVGIGLMSSRLTIRCDPQIHSTATDPRIKTALRLMGTDLVDVEWQSPVDKSVYGVYPKATAKSGTKTFKVALWKVDETVAFDYLLAELDQLNPQYWVYADYVSKVLKRPPVWQGTVSRKAPVVVDVPRGYYILGTPDAEERERHDYGFSEWFATDLISNGSTWKGWKNFWSRDKRITDLYRWRLHRYWEGATWFRLLHCNRATEGFTYKPRYEYRSVDFGQAPQKWYDDIASWAETQAENMYSDFIDFFTG